MMDGLDYKHLYELKKLIESGQATKEQKKEYLRILYNNGNITQEQYDMYLKNQYAENVMNAALTIGAFVVFGWLLSQVIKS